MELALNAVHLFQYYIIPFVMVLGIMIFFHELGHFLVAKHFGVKVLKFALGFGPVLVAKTIGETEYSIRYFPLGGFVKMHGEDIPGQEDKGQETPQKDDEKSFSNKHPLKRIAIVAAGPIFNLVLAFFLYCGFFLIAGIDVTLPEIGEVIENKPAQAAGFKKGDLITAIGDKKIENWSELREGVKDKAGIPLTVTVMRGDQRVILTVTPEESMMKDTLGQDVKAAAIGIKSAGESRNIKLGLGGAIIQSFSETWMWTKLTFLVIGKLFRGLIPIETLGGPILIGQMTGQIVQKNIGYIVPFMAIISINLGILNLLPIPILDGGLIFFLLFELITGRPLSIRKQEIAQRVGLFLLLLLMSVVIYNDITRGPIG